MEALALWAPIIISVIAAGVSIAALVRQVKRDRADIAEKYENMATRQLARIEQLENEVTELRPLRGEVNELRRIIEEWEEGIKTLLCQLTDNDIEPEWKPDQSQKQRPNAERT